MSQLKTLPHTIGNNGERGGMDKKAPLKDEIMNRGVETGAGCSEGERWSLERQPIDSKASKVRWAQVHSINSWLEKQKTGASSHCCIIGRQREDRLKIFNPLLLGKKSIPSVTTGCWGVVGTDG